MEKKTILDIAYWIMILAVIGTCIFIYFYLTSNASQCIANPLEYYQNKINAQCYCARLTP